MLANETAIMALIFSSCSPFSSCVPVHGAPAETSKVAGNINMKQPDKTVNDLDY